MRKVFPFTLHPMDWGRWVESPRDFREAFLKAKKWDKTWYAYGVTVHSRAEVTFTIYDMHDICHGGLGKVQSEFTAIVDKSVTEKAVRERVLELAEERLREELQHEARVLIGAYADEILAEIGEE